MRPSALLSTALLILALSAGASTVVQIGGSVAADPVAFTSPPAETNGTCPGGFVPTPENKCTYPPSSCPTKGGGNYESDRYVLVNNTCYPKPKEDGSASELCPQGYQYVAASGPNQSYCK